MSAGDRRRNTATRQDISPLLKASFPEGLTEGSFPSTGIAFLQTHELLIRELLLATPRVTAGLIQEGCNAAFQDLSSEVAVSFSQVVAGACSVVWQKKGQVLSGKKLKPDALRRLVLVLLGPSQRKQANVPSHGRFLKGQQLKRAPVAAETSNAQSGTSKPDLLAWLQAMAWRRAR